MDHRPDIRVGVHRRVELKVTAGDHTISHDHMFFGQDPQRVHVEPGQTVYFQYQLPMYSPSLVFEVADDQVSAARTANNCKLEN